MQRVEINVVTGDVNTVDLTAAEEAAAIEATAIEAAANTPDAKAGSAVDAMTRLNFEVDFDMENRMRVREGKQQITRIQYRDALIDKWKTFNS